MWCESLLCDVCSNETNDLRVLDCKHKLCVDCCSQFRNDLVWRALVCPLDMKITNLHNVNRTVDDLPTLKEALNILCEECNKTSSLKNHWFCRFCNNTVLCSYCAMKKHRNHTCEEVNIDRLMAECISFLEPFVNKSKIDYNVKIDEFCTALCQQLKCGVQSEKAMSIFYAVAEKYIKTDLLADASSTLKKDVIKTKSAFEKKLKLISTILSKIDSDYSVGDKVDLNKAINAKFKAPSMVRIADLFFKYSSNLNCVEDVPLSADLSSNSTHERIHQLTNVVVNNNVPLCDTKVVSIEQIKQVKSIVVNTEKNSVSVSQCVPMNVTVNYDKELICSWHAVNKKLELTNPSSLCAIQNVGVALLDHNGIHLFDTKLNLIQSKGLSANKLTDFQHKPAIAYHVERNSIFILKEVPNDKLDGNKILEFKIPSLKRVQAMTYPPINDNNRRLLGILNGGDLLCVSSSVMIIVYPTIIECSRKVWQRADETFEPFEDLVVRSDVHKSSIYIMGASEVYLFTLANNSTNPTFIRKIKIGHSWPILLINNSVYGLNSEQNALVTIETDEIDIVTNINVEGCRDFDGSIVEMSAAQHILYMLHCSSKALYSGIVNNPYV